MSEASEKLAAKLIENEITIDATFIPWSKSRNAKLTGVPGHQRAKTEDRSLNWRITLKRHGRDVYTTYYTAGIAHCPSYKQKLRHGYTLEEAERIEYETENGKAARGTGSVVGFFPGKPITLDPADVVSSLLLDGEAIDFPTYEDFADNFGYERDSRKGETTYRECLACGLALRAAFGDSLLQELRELAREM